MSVFHSFTTMQPAQRLHMLATSLKFVAPGRMVTVNGPAAELIVTAKAAYDVIVMQVVAAHMDWRKAKIDGADPREIANYETILEKKILNLASAGCAGWGIKLEGFDDDVDGPGPRPITATG